MPRRPAVRRASRWASSCASRSSPSGANPNPNPKPDPTPNPDSNPNPKQELAKRRGLARQMGGGGLDDDLPDGGEDGGEGAEDAGAFTVGRPLAQKAFERELSKVLQASDILVEVLDARDPLGCRCKPLEDAVLTKWQSKRVVLLLNKCDLVPPDVVTKPSNRLTV